LLLKNIGHCFDVAFPSLQESKFQH
jgi:hypothetical protein